MRDSRDPKPQPPRAVARPLDEGLQGDRPGAGEPETGASTLADRLAFLVGFIRDPSGVGSVAPSSARLERRLVRNARIAEARTIVELGPGTGGTTRAFLKAMSPQARLVAIELDPVFHARLADTLRDPRLFVEHGSAERIAEFLAARRLPAPDAIVSGIPFSTMPQDVGERIAASVADVLAPGGRFVAYQVRPRVAEFTSPHLGPPKFEWEPWNIPPMRVFTWVRR
jgi:phosphatidylethanolamine/phosphatidyl-N-methylethanolamine N-methyltransferase